MADWSGPHAGTLPDWLRRHASRTPARIAYSFLRETGEVEDITYAGLAARVEPFAAGLAERVGRGERVLLLYPSGIDFIVAFLACLAAGAVAVPAAPMHRPRDRARLAALLADTAPALVLCASELEPATAAALERAGWPPTLGEETDGGVPGAVRARAVADPGGAGREPDAGDDAVAFLQYTSGSTGQPKGVEISHDNIAANVRTIAAAFGFRSDTVMVSWLPLFHDMGLIGSVCAPLVLGFRSILMAPGTFLRRPAAWLEAVSRFGATCSGAPNFAWDLCVRRIDAAQKQGLQLSSLEVLYNGAEPVRVATLDRFLGAFAACGLRPDALFPCYGMAEATLLVAGGPRARPARIRAFEGAALEGGHARETDRDAPGARVLVSCGPAAPGVTVAVVDPVALVRAAPGATGEIWLAGGGVARGYHGRARGAGDVFGARIADAPPHESARVYLRSGDIGFLHGGELFVTGRRKDVVIVHGRKLHAQDIEALVEDGFPELAPNSCAAFALEDEGGERLALAIEASRTLARRTDLASLAQRIRAAVAEGIGVVADTLVFVAPGGFPRTTSGKLRRSRCKALLLGGTLPLLAPRTRADPDGAGTAGSIGNPDSAGRADAVIGWLREYAPRRLDLRLADERRSLPPHVLLDFGRRGLFGLQAPLDAGGLLLSTRDLVRVMQQLAAIDLSLATLVGVHNALGLRPLLRFAPAELRTRWLPELAGGRQLAAFAMSEPQAGSNPRAIGTRALRVDGGWRVSGEKHLIGLASWAGVLTVFGRAFDPDGRALGTVALLVPEDAPGLVQGPEALTMGMRAVVQNAVSLDAVFVPDEAVLGVPGAGMDVAHDAMGFARLGIGALCIGAMKRCAQLMARFASRREIAGGRLLDNPVTRLHLHELDCAIAAGEALVAGLAAQVDEGGALPLDACSAAKCVLSELLWEFADRLVQMLGGRGYLENNLAPQLLRDARALRILEGPTEALYAHLGALVRLPGNPLAHAIATRFGAPILAGQLAGLAGRAVGQWQDGRSGAFAAWTLLAAAAPPSAAGWACRRLELLGRHIEEEEGWLAASPPADTLLARVAGYTTGIGDGEPGTPGEARGIDPMLARGWAPPASGIDGGTMPSPSGGPIARQMGRLARNGRPQGVLPFAQARRGAGPPATAVHGVDEGTPGLVGLACAAADVPESSLAQVLDCLLKWFREGGAGDGTMRSIGADTPFSDLGIDSLATVPLALELEAACGVPLGAELLYDYPTARALAGYVDSLRGGPRGLPGQAPGCTTVELPGCRDCCT